MIKSEPLLSICIPAYNREKYLKRLIESIVSQEEFIETDEVEIIVDDGPSSDNTESMVKEYIKKYWNKIKYYRNPVRIWMCPAFLEALELWIWKYLWLMGSDDSINEIGLWVILKKIKDTSPKLILSKRCPYEELNRDNKIIETKDFNWFQDFSTYLSINYLWLKWWQIAEDRDTFFTFISVFCINKEYYNKAHRDLLNHVSKDYLNHHYFNFSFIAYSQLFNSDILSIIESPRMIWVQKNETSWIPNKKIADDLKDEMDYIKEHYVLSNWSKKCFKRLLYPWIMSWLLTPFRNFMKSIWLLSLYNSISKKYRKLRGYL